MKQIAILCLMTLVLCSCGSKAPTCSDKRTLNLLREIYYQQLEKKLAAGGFNRTFIARIIGVVDVEINTIITAAYDTNIDKCTCEAVMETKLPSELLQIANSIEFRTPTDSTRTIGIATGRNLASVHVDTPIEGVDISADSLKSDIHYTSQLTSDKGEHVVTLQGHLPSINAIVEATRINDEAKIEQTRLAKPEKADNPILRKIKSRPKQEPEVQPVYHEDDNHDFRDEDAFVRQDNSDEEQQ